MSRYLFFLLVIIALVVSSLVSDVYGIRSSFQETLAMEESEMHGEAGEASKDDGRPIGQISDEVSTSSINNNDQSSDDGNGIPLLAPASTSDDPNRRSLKLGESLKLSEVGPMIINPDGTVRRIANWDILTEAERENTWRIIKARNKKRLDKLKQQQEGDNSNADNATTMPSTESLNDRVLGGL